MTALALVASNPRDRTSEASTSEGAALPRGGTLILCPKSTLRATWLTEVNRRMVRQRLPEAAVACHASISYVDCVVRC